jgi:Ankyrin repeats (many copies)/Ankyrin repeat
MVNSDAALMRMVQAIVAADNGAVLRLLAANPALANAQFEIGATRQTAKAYFIDAIGRYNMAGDTALHIAAAAHRKKIAQMLLAAGADVRAKNRRGAEPLHSAAVGRPGSRAWNPRAQAATIGCLIAAGADPNALNKDGVAPLHVAVRTRSAAAVQALLDGGADPRRKNKSGSTPMRLATLTTGRSGSGSPEAKTQQAQIAQLLEQYIERA